METKIVHFELSAIDQEAIRIRQEKIQRVLRAIEDTESNGCGEVRVVVQDGAIIQIDKIEKLRFI